MTWDLHRNLEKDAEEAEQSADCFFCAFYMIEKTRRQEVVLFSSWMKADPDDITLSYTRYGKLVSLSEGEPLADCSLECYNNRVEIDAKAVKE